MESNMENISLIIHGEGSRHWLEQIFKDIKKTKFTFKEIVIVSYKKDIQIYKSFLKSNQFNYDIKLVQCFDLLNPGFFNVNRQIYSIKLGLEKVSHDSYVIKLRNDQSVDFSLLIAYLQNLNESMILSTNCYTRSDRLYHPSDMLLAGKKDDLLKYFSCPMMTNTHLGHILQSQKEFELSNYTLKALNCTPESYLFKNYIKSNGWQIKNTHEDSLLALKKFIYLIDSWDINYRWKEKRVPFLPKGCTVLPYYFNMAPFENGPIEKCRCINKHEFMQIKPTLKTSMYILLSKIVYSLKYDVSYKKNRYKLTYKVLKLFRSIAYIFPYIITYKSINILNSHIDRTKRKYKMYKQIYKR